MGLLNIPSQRFEHLDADRRRQAGILAWILQVLVIVTLLLYIDDIFFAINRLTEFIAISLAIGVEAAAWLLLRSARVRAASIVLIAGLWLLLTATMFVSDYHDNSAWILLVVVVLIAGMLLGSYTGLAVAGLNTVVGLIYLVGISNNLFAKPLLQNNPPGVWITISLAFFACSGLILLTNRSTQEALEEVRRTAETQVNLNRELETIRGTLVTQVEERTHDLQVRTQYLQAAVEISRATASILDIHRLMESAAELIREKFNLYYTGLFLVDPSGEWAILQAGTGEAGRRMLDRGHRIRVGSGMVGWSIANSQPRIALDVDKDIVRLAASELPETRSEAAIPLRSHGKVLGALTVQSTQPEAFGEMEIAIFQTLADQLAIALDNARLLNESQQALNEARQAQGQMNRRAWQEFVRSSGVQSIKYRFGQVEAGGTTHDEKILAARRQATTTGQPVQVQAPAAAGEDARVLILPIQVRDQVVGAISFTKEPERSGAARQNGSSKPANWQDDEIELLETITGQLGVALDSARLYQGTQRLAFREQLSGEVTSRIRQTLDIQAVLRTAVEEIQKSLNLPEVVISLTPPEND